MQREMIWGIFFAILLWLIIAALVIWALCPMLYGCDGYSVVSNILSTDGLVSCDAPEVDMVDTSNIYVNAISNM